MSKTVRRLVRDMRSRERAARIDSSALHGADPQSMRQFNRLLVLNCIRQHGPLARVAVADRTGLSRTTVSSIVDALLDEGLVREGDTLHAARAGGRRATLVHFQADAGYILGIDIGRTHLTILATDLAAEALVRCSGPFEAALGPEICLPQIVERIHSFVAEHAIPWDRIVGIGIGIPGPLDTERQALISPPRMPGWDGVEIGQFLRRELDVAQIYIENDANLGALGECRFGAGRGVSDLAYIKLGTGIGGGLVMNGAIYRGSFGSAGELGHVTIDENGPLCDCGSRGCLETLAGAAAIVADARAARPLVLAGDREDHGQHAESGDAIRDISDVIHAAQEGEVACRAAIERAGEHIGAAIASLINLVNPSLILFDGGVTRAGELLLEPLRRTVGARSLQMAWARTSISTGELGNNAIALGAVSMVIDAAFGIQGSIVRPLHVRATLKTIEASPPPRAATRRGAGQ
jgi:glucokinase-like ROK family protein